MWVFFFSLLMWWLTLINFWMCSLSGINPTWSWHIILFIHCQILSANILLRVFVSVCKTDLV
jgi:hypothetical protein